MEAAAEFRVSDHRTESAFEAFLSDALEYDPAAMALVAARIVQFDPTHRRAAAFLRISREHGVCDVERLLRRTTEYEIYCAALDLGDLSLVDDLGRWMLVTDVAAAKLVSGAMQPHDGAFILDVLAHMCMLRGMRRVELKMARRYLAIDWQASHSVSAFLTYGLMSVHDGVDVLDEKLGRDIYDIPELLLAAEMLE